MKNQAKMGKNLGLADERFKHLTSDPKFSQLSNVDRKVVIGERFAAALTDARFSSRARVDKRGRRMKKTTGNDLLDLYDIEGHDRDSDEDLPVKKKIPKMNDSKKEPECINSEELSDGSSEISDNEPIKMDLARGEGNILSSSDDDSDSDWELANDINMEIDLAHLDNDAEQIEWASRRLAVCNLDWDMVKCEDIFILVNSFKPSGGSVEKITIYLSDFGKEHLEEEEKHGPRLDLSKPIEEYEGDDADEETKLAMRKYQMDRLKYYYAVIQCNSEETASAIYEQCDGLQFESSGLKMDLRFVPDDMEFEESRVRETLRDVDINVAKYRSKEKLKSSVCLTNGSLAWDENDDIRARRFHEAFINDGDGADLVADSGSEMDDNEREESRKALLALLDQKDDFGKLQVDWDNKSDSDMNESDEKTNLDKEDELTAEDQTNSTQETDKKKSAYKDYMERRKAKKRERKQKIKEMRAAEKGGIPDSNGPKRTKATPTQDQEEITVDERFNALFTDSAFAIEQSSKMSKGSKLMTRQAEVKKNAKETHRNPTNELDIISKLKNKSVKWSKK